MEGMMRLFRNLAPYRGLFLFTSELILVAVLIIFAKALYKKLKNEYEESKKYENQPLLKHEYKGFK